MLRTLVQKFHNAFNSKPVVFTITLSFILNCFVESMGRHSLWSLFVHITERPHIFLLNTAIIMCTFLPSFFVTRRAFAVTMASTLWITCGIVNFTVMSFTALPFTAYDLLILTDVLQITGVYLSPLLAVLILAAIAAAVAGLVVAFIKLPKTHIHIKPLHIARFSLPLITLMFILNGVVSLRVRAESPGLRDAYDDYGFAYCFASGLLSRGIDEPDDYTAQSILEISSQLDTQLPGGAQHGPLQEVNVIFVQLEAFIDPAIINGLSWDEDPTPVFSALKEKYPSGLLHVPVIGGGTANVEFEVLTGISTKLFAFGEYPYETILRANACESTAYNLKELGYTASAVHNHNAAFYSRDIVYSNLGFDRFIPLEHMQNVEYNPAGWAKDEVLTEYIIECLELSDGPDYVFAVSVQGHGKYPEDFDEDVFGVSVPWDSDDPDSDMLEYYFTQLSEIDAFIGNLIEALGSINEDVVLVLYGDHLPALSLTGEQLATGSLHMTEYVIWNNIGLGAESKPLFSYELSAYVLGLLGIDNGMMTKLHQAGFPEDAAYNMMQAIAYDMLYGANYINGGEVRYVPSTLHMGP